MALQAAFLGCGLTVIGIVVAIAGLIGLQPALRSARWPASQGEVLHARIIRQEGRPRAQVRYQYRVGEKTFTGGRVSFHGGRTLPGLPAEPAEALLKRYPAGASVPVYYDPTRPERSVLEPGAGGAVYLPMGLGGLLFLVGLILGLMALL